MLRTTKILFLIYAVIELIIGVPLLIAPGRFVGVGLEGWAPLLFRLLGAALIALAWASYHTFRGMEPEEVQSMAITHIIFCALGAVGFLRHLVAAYYYPFIVWFIFGFLAISAILWGGVLFLSLKKKS